MLFPSTKKRLWRCRVNNSSGTTTSSSCQNHCPQTRCHQQQQHLHPYPPVQNRNCANDERNVCYESASPSKFPEDEDQTMSSVGSGNEMNNTPPRIPKSPTATTMIGSAATSVFRNCCPGGGGGSRGGAVDDEKKLFQAFLDKLSRPQQTKLLQAMENGGSIDGRTTDCVLIQREAIMKEEPNVIACRFWRWPDLQCATELKRIPECPNNADPVYICCNPYHWGRLFFADTPPPPYQLYDIGSQNVEGLLSSESMEEGSDPPESLPTDGGDSLHPTGWCQLAYWEQAQRVGDIFPVENSFVNVFYDQPRGDGMCLKILSNQRKSETPEAVNKVRQKIGLGVTLSQETDSVWLYNRSSEDIFIYSPTLNKADGRFRVSKVLPGYCLKAYNYRAMSQTLLWPKHIAGAQMGPVDTFSMRISFVKGWGSGYKRQDVTSCPCWLEVLLTRR
ncbi:mothers against decapentaplegic homolog 6 [Hermetia illucens]|uniref:mothers against decapentaplegic homolog 6 n=1 Tax=Hermetia illucens TaxID=343691 RepID=UPI0018CBFBC7|nr:mothers against decapentaplegic homolog 6 [Hermetia illucens]